MASGYDFAQYINDQFWQLSKIKLQKLLYFAQTWSLVRNGKPLFPDDFVAWEKGPAIIELHEVMSSSEKIVPLEIPGANSSNLTNGEMGFIDSIIDIYGEMSKEELVELAHNDSAWKDAKRDEVISKDTIADCYRNRPLPLK